MLYRPDAFEPLTDEAWDAARVCAAIREIVADTDGALRGPKLLWRADDWDRWRATSPLKDVFVGAAGVLWALGDLRERGHAESRLDLGDLALRALERHRARPDLPSSMDLPEPRESSLLAGEAGILLCAYRLGRAAELADELHARVRANLANEAEEVMWGAPGTLIAARLMLAWTGDERWRDACRETADALWSRRREDGLWIQRLHGQEFRYLGPVHGLVGIVQALGAGPRRRPARAARARDRRHPRSGRPSSTTAWRTGRRSTAPSSRRRTATSGFSGATVLPA